MMTADDLLADDTLLPGDVVVDETTHKPMQVTGFDLRPAEQVDEVWQSSVNQHKHDLDPDATVMELVDIPTGRRYFVPEDVSRYPVQRLDRVLTEPATTDRRVQAKVVRAVLAHLVADARDRGYSDMADGMLALMEAHFTDRYAGEIEEFSQTVPPISGETDG